MNYQPFTKFSRIARVDELTHSTFGLMTEEQPDLSNEKIDYIGQKPFIEQWAKFSSDATSAAGTAISYGNLRLNHTATIAGRVSEPPRFDDEKKQVWVTTCPTPDVWELIRTGCVVGLSIAGQYVRRWCDSCGTDIERGNDCPTCMKHVTVRFTAKLAECSYTDRPALPSATFQFIRAADGAIEMRKFQPTKRFMGWHQDPWDDSWIFVPPPPQDDRHGFESDTIANPTAPFDPAAWRLADDSGAADSHGFEGVKQCLF